MTTVFIDGESGTTGLRLRDRLLGRTDIELLSLSAEERRSTEARRDMMKQADITVLCLPDGASREAVSLAEGTGTRLLDASSAHRTEPGWVYGCPELEQAYPEAIARAGRVSVPGCHATGVVLMLAPLISQGLIPAEALLSVTSITGYSGGGKNMIAAYEGKERRSHDSYSVPRPYACFQTHKHLPEIVRYAGLRQPPVFMPIVGDFKCGMCVTIPLHLKQYGLSAESIAAVWTERYARSAVVTTVDYTALSATGEDRPDALSGFDKLQMCVVGNEERVLLMALYDNLGKGSLRCSAAVPQSDDRCGPGYRIKTQSQ